MKHMLTKRIRNFSIFISTTLNHQDSVEIDTSPPPNGMAWGGGLVGKTSHYTVGHEGGGD